MKKDGNHPLTDSLGQIEHQTVQTTYGDVVDHDEVKYDVIDSDGNPVVSEDEETLTTYIKQAISVENLFATFHESAHQTLLKLLALQDNAHPLKKGGIGIAYRTDALIMHCKMEFSAEENIVFDAILGSMSSYPENTYYKIEPASFLKYSKYKNPKYIYTVFQNGVNKLRKRQLVFDNLGPDGRDDIYVNWYDILRYHKGHGKDKDKEEAAYIEFVPSEFFKDLALCSQLVHGAYGALEVTTQLQGKYTIALYWFLENKKLHKEYPGATPGVFSMDIDEMKLQFSIPKSYSSSDIKRRVLDPAMNSINSVDECDFVFSYEAVKLRGNGTVVGFRFKIKTKKYIAANKKMAIEERDDLFIKIKMFLETSNIDFTDSEIKKVCAQARRLDRDAMYMMQIVLGFRKRLDDEELEPIEDKVSYLCKMIELGTSETAIKTKKSKKKDDNPFNNFKQNDYDFDKLEEQIIDN